ncbi:serine/threonine protein kinase [Geodermatophilus amargosae]|uniref:serine/threonine protein kinase n=1 Tax=Geodermatophilus amargosae TaxID=1296565 RepID=UPI0034DF8888
MDPTSDLLGGRYRLESVLASGGMGRVWRATDTLLQRAVAVKVLRSEYTGDPSFLQRFRAEARHAALLNDPHIAAVHDYGETVGPGGEPLAYLVMELVAGESLSDLLARVGRLDMPTTLDLLRQTASALAAAHAAGVVHRDVKPGNVLVAPDGVVKITDFGIAWSASSVPLTGTGQVIGTAHYLSPEQAKGAKASPASDVYALGVVAYECLSGRRPFDGESSVQVALMQIQDEPPPLPPDVPADVRMLVERAMVKDPAVRYPDGGALRDAVDGVLRHRSTAPAARHDTVVLPAAAPAHTAVLPAPVPVPVPVPDTPAPGAPGRSRRGAVLAGVLALLALAVVGVVLALTNGDPEGTAASPATTSSSATTAPTAAPTTAPTTAPAPSSAPTPTGPGPVDVVAADLVGRPLADVRAALTALGLSVQPQPVVTGEVPADQVTAVAPEGPVLPGQTVTVTYAVAPPADDDPGGDDGDGEGDQGNGNGNGNGNGGGNGNRGNGNGNGRGGDD